MEGEGVRRDRWDWGHLGRGRNLVQWKRPRISAGNPSEDS